MTGEEIFIGGMFVGFMCGFGFGWMLELMRDKKIRR